MGERGQSRPWRGTGRGSDPALGGRHPREEVGGAELRAVLGWDLSIPPQVTQQSGGEGMGEDGGESRTPSRGLPQTPDTWALSPPGWRETVHEFALL